MRSRADRTLDLMPTDPVVRPAVWSTVAFAVASAVAVASNDGAAIVAQLTTPDLATTST